jgi:pimeloyl-ACP methyl ester carboxylesterase
MELHLHEWGDPGAPPVVCIHGVNAHGRRFRRLAEERLAKRFRALAPDLRGHGFSDWEPPWTIATHAHDVLETLDAAGIRSAPFVGHSFGGRLILELAVLDPDRLERVALLDPAIQILPHVGLDFAPTIPTHRRRSRYRHDWTPAFQHPARSSRRKPPNISCATRTAASGFATARARSSQCTGSSALPRRLRRR